MLLTALFLLLSLLGPRPASGVEAGGYVHPETGLVFGETLGGLSQLGVRDFEKESPGLGVGVHYGSIGVTASVYVYREGHAAAPATGGAETRAVQAEFEGAVNEIRAMVELGRYESVREMVSPSVARLPGTGGEVLSTTFFCVADEGERVSTLLLTAYRGHFVKLRMTWDAALGPEGPPERLRFLEALGRLLAQLPPGQSL